MTPTISLSNWIQLSKRPGPLLQASSNEVLDAVPSFLEPRLLTGLHPFEPPCVSTENIPALIDTIKYAWLGVKNEISKTFRTFNCFM